MRLPREDFFGHPRTQKLASAINKKTKEGNNALLIKEVALIDHLKQNEDWLDYVGLKLDFRNKKTVYLKWELE